LENNKISKPSTDHRPPQHPLHTLIMADHQCTGEYRTAIVDPDPTQDPGRARTANVRRNPGGASYLLVNRRPPPPIPWSAEEQAQREQYRQEAGHQYTIFLEDLKPARAAYNRARIEAEPPATRHLVQLQIYSEFLAARQAPGNEDETMAEFGLENFPVPLQQPGP
jgi:hypothetical protein